MPSIRISTACIQAASVVSVTVEADLQRGLPHFTIIGLPDRQLGEARERVRSAIKNSGFVFPLGRITVNLAPSALPKSGSGFDLAIALAVLGASGQVRVPSLQVCVLGELGLSGSVGTHQHLVPILAQAPAGFHGFLLPACQKHHAHALGRGAFYGAASLREAVQWCQQSAPRFIAAQPASEPFPLPVQYAIDQIQGQLVLKRSLLIALAGRHHLFVEGPPGIGKTAAGVAAAELLPPLRRAEANELSCIYAYAGMQRNPGDCTPPCRIVSGAVHSNQLLGKSGQPGELSLASFGILLLDEFAEVSRQVRESLRCSLEAGTVQVRYGKHMAEYPARGTVIAVQNMCPCGKQGIADGVCTCTAYRIARYRQAISAPLQDRFALKIALQREALSKNDPGLAGATMAQTIARVRSGSKPPIKKKVENWIDKAADQLSISFRGRNSIREVAKTIATIEGSDNVAIHHAEEAVQYRWRLDG